MTLREVWWANAPQPGYGFCPYEDIPVGNEKSQPLAWRLWLAFDSVLLELSVKSIRTCDGYRG
jgi:hypothetical protein